MSFEDGSIHTRGKSEIIGIHDQSTHCVIVSLDVL
jgi:hypothetical protein